MELVSICLYVQVWHSIGERYSDSLLFEGMWTLTL